MRRRRCMQRRDATARHRELGFSWGLGGGMASTRSTREALAPNRQASKQQRPSFHSPALPLLLLLGGHRPSEPTRRPPLAASPSYNYCTISDLHLLVFCSLPANHPRPAIEPCPRDHTTPPVPSSTPAQRFIADRNCFAFATGQAHGSLLLPAATGDWSLTPRRASGVVPSGSLRQSPTAIQMVDPSIVPE